MPQTSKTTILAVLVTGVMVSGCRPQKGTASPEDYYSLIQVALQGGKVASMIGRNESIGDKNFAGCVASDVLASAFASAGDALNGKLTDSVEIPGFELDLADCMAFKPAPEAQVTTVSNEVAGYGPEEESPDPAPEPTPAPEPDPVPEPESEPTPTPEPGNPEVASLVEGIAGVAIIAGTHYATKLKTTDCKKGTLALAVIGYVAGMVKPIADEIADPDGKVSIPAIPVDLSGC